MRHALMRCCLVKRGLRVAAGMVAAAVQGLEAATAAALGRWPWRLRRWRRAWQLRRWRSSLSGAGPGCAWRMTWRQQWQRACA
ncbi:hypothetical protein CHLRE_09g396586v5 [Chlamydomonas reinhardtii]|uniref:Uncharacterized protein n=1 Tax=Chlamydomonas reinhardtii TaxID=3055 RepID=A0A2K3DD55_CHLRE|nr:uncharacterized protein CHLRE_09g396586v5 [Chlamydomonas reinhardtii]PNW78461.1 hypothetical protein CHLRE_09g396586v5 [Chlamydomonas reinhardtii]